jgi:hypothetical protein
VDWLTERPGLFASENDPTIPPPHSLIGAGSSAEEYDLRFPSEDLRLPIAADNALDDHDLKNYLDNFGLDNLFTQVKSLAMEAAAQEAGEELERGKREAEFAMAWKEPGSRPIGRSGILGLLGSGVKRDEVDDEGFYADGEEEDVDQSSMDVDEEPLGEEAAIRF